MFRFLSRLLLIAAAMLVSTQIPLAQAHGSESSEAPPAAKQDAPALPVRAIIVNRRPILVDLKGMTLYYFDRDDSGD